MAFTFFFRDAETLRLAIEDALPRLRDRAFIHVWDAGCAHGPEPYTLAILLRERMSDYVFRNVHLHATDLDSSFAESVTSGVFPKEEVQRVPPDIRHKYFRPASRPGCVQVVPELRARIAFAQRDLLALEPVREGLSLIVCKNVLLHFQEHERVRVLRMFHRALQPEGTLVMEHTQKLPDRLRPLFRQVAPHAQVYRKVEAACQEYRPQEQEAPGSQTRRRIGAAEDGSFPHTPRSHLPPVRGERV